MPEVGDIVLYRLVVSEFYGIEKEKKNSYCKIRSLEGDGCYLKFLMKMFRFICERYRIRMNWKIC